jgi:hypothetical protein
MQAMIRTPGFIHILCLAWLFLSRGLPAAQKPVTQFMQSRNESGFWEIRTENGITFRWKAEKDLLRVVLSARTTGWVAVGFDPVEMMKGANFVIGYVKEGMIFVGDGDPLRHTPRLR